MVDNSIKILDDFKSLFDKTMDSVRKFKEEFYQKLKLAYPNTPEDELDWEQLNAQRNDMFAQMKNFIGRCNNLKEICECISQFMIEE